MNYQVSKATGLLPLQHRLDGSDLGIEGGLTSSKGLCTLGDGWAGTGVVSGTQPKPADSRKEPSVHARQVSEGTGVYPTGELRSVGAPVAC